MSASIEGEEQSYEEESRSICDRIFSSCSDDPKSSVHRTWTISLVLLLAFFAVTCHEVHNLRSGYSSVALQAATVWTAIMQIVMAVMGSFILKRFSTSFLTGFLLGFVIIFAQQNLLITIAYFALDYGTAFTNHTFGILAFIMFIMYSVFGIILWRFKESILIAPVDAKGLRFSSNNGGVNV